MPQLCAASTARNGTMTAAAARRGSRMSQPAITAAMKPASGVMAEPSLRRGARLALGCAGLASWLGLLPFGGAVGDQAGDGQEGFVEVFSSSEVALQGPPLLVLGIGVLD